MKTGGIVSRMLDMFCPGVYPGVLLWPICHPYGYRPVLWRMPPWRQGLVSYYRSSELIRTATSLKAWFLPPSLELVHSLGDPLLSRSSVCSSFRPVSDISAHCSNLRGSSHLGSTRTLVPRTALPAKSPPYDPKLKKSLATRRGHSSCCGSLRSVPGLG